MQLMEGVDMKQLDNNFNGVGPEWMPNWARNLLTRMFKCVELSAKIHDYEYMLFEPSTNKTTEGFHEVNYRFRSNMSRETRFNKVNPVYGYLVVILLYTMVELYGHKSYGIEPNKATLYMRKVLVLIPLTILLITIGGLIWLFIA